MGLAICKTRSTYGIEAHEISVEVHLSNGLPAFHMVGLPETIVKESKDRVRSAIINSQFHFPLGRITVNLSPAHLPKTGSGFDLAIAIGILAASQQITATLLDTHEFVAELGLNGQLHPIHGLIPIALAAQQASKKLIIASHSRHDLHIIQSPDLLIAQSLQEVCHYLCQRIALKNYTFNEPFIEPMDSIDWSDIKGQHHAKKALEIAAYGGHSVLLCGPPGSGKTMLAKRFITLLPPLSKKQCLESAALYSIVGRTRPDLHRPPLRMPHHTASHVALVGGGNPPKPGEISLAHHGVLFLDELPEFQKKALETLREPLESGSIHLSRASQQIELPAAFQLITAMNPCPCGYEGQMDPPCHCTTEAIKRYQQKISGPILDRIDLHVRVQALSQAELCTNTPEAPISATIRSQVISMQAIQYARQDKLNGQLSPKECDEFCTFSTEAYHFLQTAFTQFKLSGRGFERLRKISRTIADSQHESNISLTSLKQALSFRKIFL